VIRTREKTRNESRRKEYRQLVPASFQIHPGKFRAIQGRHEVLEGSAIEEIVILEFPLRGRHRLVSQPRIIKRLANTASGAATAAASSAKASLPNLDPVCHTGSPS